MRSPSNWYNWGQYYDRFDVSKEPNEPGRFGWVVEIDPFDPNAVPVKRTALGRYKHEDGAANVVNKDGRFVVYMGDDERFDYVYKFVTEAASTPRTGRRTGTSSTMARSMWRSTTPTAPASGSRSSRDRALDGAERRSQADVLIETRRAGDLVGATKMDRPEGGGEREDRRVYVMLTNNTRRKVTRSTRRTRAENAFGHIVEMLPDGGDHPRPGSDGRFS